MKVAIINDTHWGVRNDSAAFLDHFRKFYSEVFFPVCEEQGIDTILHLGDLVDRRKYINYVTAKNMHEIFMQPIIDNDMTLHCVVGNHDTFYKNTNDINSVNQLYSHSDSKNLNFYWNEPIELDFDGTKIMLSPWICPSNQQETMDVFEKTSAQILMGHFEIQGFEMMKGHLCDHGLSKNIFSKFDIVYSGHFHHPSENGNIKYLGAPYEMNWSDHGQRRGFNIFDTETRELTHVPNPFKMFHKIVYDDEDMTVEDVSNLDISQLTNTYIKVIIKNKSNPYVFDLFIDRLMQSSACDIKVVEDHQNLDVIDESELIDEAEDTLTILKKYVDSLDIKKAGNKQRVEAILRDLYQEAINL